MVRPRVRRGNWCRGGPVSGGSVDCEWRWTDEGIRSDRPLSGERGGQVRVRGPRRGDPRHRRLPARLGRALHPHPPRAGRRVHGRRLRAAHRPRGRLPRHARPGRHQPGDRSGRRQPGPRAPRGDHRAGGPGPRSQGVAPVRGHRRAHAPAHQVERARRDAGGHPRSVPQGLQGGRNREAGRLSHRGARGRGGGGGRGRAALHRAPAAPIAGSPGAPVGRAPHRGRLVPAHLRGQRGDPRRRLQGAARLLPRPRHPGGQHLHGQGMHAVRRSARPAHRRAAGARLRLLRLREGGPDHRGGLRPGRVRAQVLEPGAQEAHHPHRLHPRRGGRALPAGGRGGGGRARGARAAQRSGEGPEGSGALPRAARLHPGAARGGRGRRYLPDQAAAHPARSAARRWGARTS